MTEKELCKMCTEYSSDNQCEHKNECKLLKIIKENKNLKEENKKLKKKMSYMINPNCIGDRNGEMGW